MTSNDGQDRRLTAWLEDDAVLRAPQSLETAFIEGVATKRQRPGWATTERWVSMETRALFGAVPPLMAIAISILLLAAIAAGTYAVGSSLTTPLPDAIGLAVNGRIAFDSDGDIITVAADGNDRVTLTSGGAIDVVPTWAPDGTRLAFWSAEAEAGPWDLVVVRADGSGATTIASDIAGAPEPSDPPWALTWSPSGDAIAFHSVVAPDCVPTLEGYCGTRIFIASTDGSGVRQVGDPAIDAWAPAWSPDGSSIAFGGPIASGGTRDFVNGLYVMEQDGSSVRRIGGVAGDGLAFAWSSWSPNGSSIVTQAGPWPHHIYRVDTASGEVTTISEHTLDENVPTWSPTGKSIAFIRDTMSIREKPMIFDVPSSDLVSLDVPITFPAPGWAPDGTLLIAGSTEIEGLVIFDLSGNVAFSIEARDSSGA